MGNGSEVAGEYGSNGTGPGRDVKGGGAVGAIVRQQELGGDGEDVQGPLGVPPPGGATDCEADGEMWSRQRLGVPPGS